MAAFLDKGSKFRAMLDFIIDRSAIFLEILSIITTGFCQRILHCDDIKPFTFLFATLDDLKKFRMDNSSWLTWGPLGLMVLAVIIRAFTAKRISKLEDDISKYKENLENLQSLSCNLDLIINHHLLLISRELNFTHEERVSFYVARRNRKRKVEFMLCGRSSPCDSFCHAGRSSYPLDQGIIGKAWDVGFAVAEGLPDWNVDRQGYISKHKNDYKYKAKTIKNFTMHSRYLFGYRIGDDEGQKYRSVIIIESMNPDYGKLHDVKEVISKHQASLFAFARDFYEVIPSIALAKERGF